MSAPALNFAVGGRRRIARTILVLTVLLAFPSNGQVGQGNSQVQQSSGQAQPSGAQAQQGQSNVDKWEPHPRLLVLYVSLLLGFLAALHLVDALMSYAFSRESRDQTLAKLGGTLSADEIKKLIGSFTPTGIPGTTRSIVAYGLLAALGIAVFHLLTVSKFDKAPDYADKILTVLAGAFSSVIGFYFGSRATKEGVETSKPSSPPPSPSGGEITRITPSKGPPGTQVHIEGKGFGDQEGTIRFAKISADKPDEWKDNSVKVKVPQNAVIGPTAITVNPTQDKEIVASPSLFEVTQ